MLGEPDSVAWYRHRGRVRRQSDCWDALIPSSASEVEVHVPGSQLCVIATAQLYLQTIAGPPSI
jgi:hypothetical protein